MVKLIFGSLSQYPCHVVWFFYPEELISSVIFFVVLTLKHVSVRTWLLGFINNLTVHEINFYSTHLPRLSFHGGMMLSEALHLLWLLIIFAASDISFLTTVTILSMRAVCIIISWSGVFYRMPWWLSQVLCAPKWISVVCWYLPINNILLSKFCDSDSLKRWQSKKNKRKRQSWQRE